MKKTLLTIAVVLLVLVLAYPASAWYLGKQVEMAVDEPYKQIESLPYIKIVNRQYRRGIFSSEETVTFELFGDLMRYMENAQKRSAGARPETNAPPAEPFKPIQVTVRSHIKHGPLPDARKWAAAIVDSELEADERFRPALARVLGDRKLLTAHSVYGFDGGGESFVSSPAFVTTFQTGGSDPPIQVSWEGVSTNVRFSRGFASYTMQGDAPKLDIAGGKGVHMVMAGMHFDLDGRRIFDDEPLLHAGRQKFTIAQVSIDGPALGDRSVLLKQISYDVNVPVNGEFLDIVAKVTVQDALVGETNFGPAHYDFSMKRLHARTFAQLHRAMIKMYSDPAAANAASNPTAALGPLAKPALKLLEYNPEISLDRLSFKSPEGEVLIAARAKFIDIKPEDFEQPAVLMVKLDASADISLPEGLLMMPLGIKADTPEAAQTQMAMRQRQIAALAEQGYIRREGTMVTSRLEFRNGQFTVNGKPFDPAAMKAPAPPEPAAKKPPPAAPRKPLRKK